MTAETVFERPRGISGVEIRSGYAQGIVSEAPTTESRLAVFQALAEAGISIDFVKLTPDGFTFLCPESAVEATRLALDPYKASIIGHRSLVETHAVNIRDEEGLLAKLVQAAVHSGARVEHVADMHDRLLLVVDADQAEQLKSVLEIASVGIGGPSVPVFQNQATGYKIPICKGIKVMKFGGTSVATAQNRMKAALKVVSAKEQGFLPVVVVSAIGRKGEPYATDTLLSMLRDIDPNVAPDDREVDLLAGCGEILSAVIFAHTLKTLGHPACSFLSGGR